MSREEVFWKQKSRVQWIKEGDRNTSFFHLSAMKHRKANSISKLCLENGNIIIEDTEIGDQAVLFFQNLLSDQGSNAGNGRVMDQFIDKIPCLITKEDNSKMLKPISEEEVHVVLFSMGPFKAPGPDGFPPIFFQEYSDIVGADLTAVVRDFFRTGKLLK